jgi:histidine triad (HIT) family protein
MDCIFCQIIAGTSPVNMVEEWPEAIAFVPLNPVTPGHLLIVPRAHVRDFVQDPIVTAGVFARAAELAAEEGEEGEEEGLNLITSAGEAATQTVFHMHVHLIPRVSGDRVSLPWDVRHGR